MKKDVLGLMLCSMGSGVVIAIIVPGWCFFIAGALIIAGYIIMNSKC